MSNFHYTAEIPSIRVENGHMLHARIFKAGGEHVHSEIDLNRFVGNQDGTYMHLLRRLPTSELEVTRLTHRL